MTAPADVPPADWDGFARDATRLLENRGSQLAVLRWTRPELLAVRRFRLMIRNDYAGLVRSPGHDDVRAVTATTTPGQVLDPGAR